MEQIGLTLLPKHHFRVLKIITLISCDNKDLGTIIYSREINEKYNFKENLALVSENFAFSNQDSYPNDFIDNSILDSIKLIYPNSYGHSDTQFFQSDINKISRITSKDIVKTKMVFQPFIGLLDYQSLRREQLFAFGIKLNIYTYKENELETFPEIIVNYDYSINLDYEMNNLEFL
jgi:hypothetical protein